MNGLLGVKTKDSTSTKRDYHGFLDDKAPGAVKEIKRQLEKKDASFGTGLLPTKHWGCVFGGAPGSVKVLVSLYQII